MTYFCCCQRFETNSNDDGIFFLITIIKYSAYDTRYFINFFSKKHQFKLMPAATFFFPLHILKLQYLTELLLFIISRRRKQSRSEKDVTKEFILRNMSPNCRKTTSFFNPQPSICVNPMLLGISNVCNKTGRVHFFTWKIFT